MVRTADAPLNRAARKALAGDYRQWIEAALEQDDAFGRLLAAVIAQAAGDDDQLADPVADAETIRLLAKRYRGQPDGFRDNLWTRVPRGLAFSGLIPKLHGAGETYLALTSLVDFKTLETHASLETIARLVGLSRGTVARHMTTLGRLGLIHRRRYPLPGGRWGRTVRLVPDFMSKDDKTALLSQAVVPRTA